MTQIKAGTWEYQESWEFSGPCDERTKRSELFAREPSGEGERPLTCLIDLRSSASSSDKNIPFRRRTQCRELFARAPSGEYERPLGCLIDLRFIRGCPQMTQMTHIKAGACEH
jgi:hypothetical protein